MKRSSTILAVVSGKGGVGKSVVAVNLAETLVADGYRVALVDADFGQGACSVLLNEAPDASVLDLVRHTALKEKALHRTATGLTLVQGVAEAGEADRQTARLFGVLDDVLQHLRTDHEYIILDAPAGTDGAVRWALDRADLGVLVLVGEPTAISDAYRLARLVWQADPAYPLGAVVNFADTEAEACSVADRFDKVTDYFTGRVTNYLGWVPFSAHVRRSVRDQVPAVRQSGPVQRCFKKIADTLVQGRLIPLEPLGLS